MRIRAALILLVAVLGWEASPRAQSLADVARKESERRKTTKDGKVYTNTDLKPVPPPPLPDASPTPAAAAPSKAADASAKGDGSTPAAAAAAGDQEKEKSDKYWSTRMKTLRDQLERDRVLTAALQSRINGLTTEFVNRDDPAQRAQISADRQRAVSELEHQKKAVEDGTKAITALEEEARRKGIPPGWLR